MARSKSRWICQQCGFSASRSLGRCTECETWNSFVEEIVVDDKGGKRRSGLQSAVASTGPVPLDAVDSDCHQRLDLSMRSLNEVLGGGLVPGSVILMAGDPGIGKSTLLLQMAHMLSREHSVLYVSGEESVQQVKLRADRLSVKGKGIIVDAEQNVCSIEEKLLNCQSQVAIIDSVQALYHPEISSAPGSVSQVRESAALLLAAAKSKNIATILVGHVTKDGSIAGPRVLEHMVDVVLQFEGERSRQLRILRATKNRFGSTSEVGIFSMTEKGLVEVDNPGSFFLGGRLNSGQRAPSGTAVIAAAEGNKSLLLEVQSLVGTSPFPSGRRVANGLDLNRLLQILAVLEKKAGMSLSRYDVYVNIVGGFEFSDPAGDLGVALAIATSCLDRSSDPKLVLIGELGLTGEVRPVASLERRLKEAAQMGFKRAIVPSSNLPLTGKMAQMEVTGVEFLIEALAMVVPGYNFGKQKAQEEKPAVVLETVPHPQWLHSGAAD